MVELGDIVRYSAFGRSVNAIVMGVYSGDLSHQGASGEPLLDLLYIDPRRESAIEKKQIGWHPRQFVEYSVVHGSHQFSAEYKRDKAITTPAQLAAQRGQGEWSESDLDLWKEKSFLETTPDGELFDCGCGLGLECPLGEVPVTTVAESIPAIHVPVPEGDTNLEVQALEDQSEAQPVVPAPDLPEGISPKADDVAFATDNPNVGRIGKRSPTIPFHRSNQP